VKHLPEIIVDSLHPGLRLRCADNGDRELLRVWKNENKKSFFHQSDITADQQAAWFSSYLTRAEDHVFMVEEPLHGGWFAVGVVACRLLEQEETVDVYNIMRGRRPEGGCANMGKALTLLCSRILEHYREPISCKVLKENPALAWYERLGFQVDEQREGYNLLRYMKGSNS
jgi:ribosomal protein S18 acetylase RimI-like enzyme